MSGYQTANYDGEIAFDGTIEQDAKEFILLLPGEYQFKVRNIEKGRYEGKPNGLPACNMVKVELEINTPQGTEIVYDNIYLHTRVEWRISSFFACIGMKKKGEPLRMDWNIIGKTGLAKIENREYNGKKYNNISSYSLPEDYDKPTKQATWTQGSFS